MQIDTANLKANAFALPARTVVMSDALVKAYENQPSVLAGILGHELTHVNKQHGRQQVYRSLSLYVWMALITGDLGPFVEEFLSGGELLMGLVYSREHELDADAGAVHLLIKAGYDPQGLIYFFKNFDKKQNIFAAQEGYETNRQETEIFSWFSTHPSNAARITAMEKQITSQ